jgi:hypothetical protein
MVPKRGPSLDCHSVLGSANALAINDADPSEPRCIRQTHFHLSQAELPDYRYSQVKVRTNYWDSRAARLNRSASEPDQEPTFVNSMLKLQGEKLPTRLIHQGPGKWKRRMDGRIWRLTSTRRFSTRGDAVR